MCMMILAQLTETILGKNLFKPSFELKFVWPFQPTQDKGDPLALGVEIQLSRGLYNFHSGEQTA